MVMDPPPTRDSAVSLCFHGCLAFLHRHFPPQSPTSHPLDPSLHSQQQPLCWDCSTVPKLQLSGAVPSRGPTSLSGLCMAAAKTVLIPYRLPKNSRFTLSLKSFSSNPDSCPDVGIGPLLQFPHTLKTGPVLLTPLLLPLVPLS